MSFFADIHDPVCWVIKRGEEYLDAPHWRIWGDLRLAVRFKSRDDASKYIYPQEPGEPPERIVKLVKRRK